MNLDGDSAGILVLIAPMIGWIWIAVIMMGVGGLVALIPSRRPAVILNEAKEPLADAAGDLATT